MNKNQITDLSPEIKVDIIQNKVVFKYSSETLTKEISNLLNDSFYNCQGFLCKNEKDDFHGKRGCHKVITKIIIVLNIANIINIFA